MPYLRLLPIAQAAPARHAGAATHLLGQVLPGNARLEHEQNAREGGAVGHPRAARLQLVAAGRGQQRRHHRPQLVAHQGFGHAADAAGSRPLLLGALSQLLAEV